ncbi:MAG: LPXTG cell wall anchor domain-containing protein, partial [Clostridia bacterium]|nr:LPXTG cell wall anchor domain-containing protein [Clostridia bacterium]
RGITRYGQWYGNPYGDWSAMFAAFCLHFAGYPPDVTPYNAGVESMRLAWRSAGLTAADGPPRLGVLIFLDDNADGKADRAAVVVTSAGGQLITVEGDVSGAVTAAQVAADDPRIVDIGALPERPPQAEEGVTEIVMDSLQFDAEAASNGWQIVAESSTSHTTATFPEGATGDNVDVQLRKYVEPTEVEDEFLVHLEIDKKLSWSTVFKYGEYIGATTNKYGVDDIGKFAQINSNHAPITIKQQTNSDVVLWLDIRIIGADGKVISSTGTIKRYCNIPSASNTTILLRTGGTDDKPYGLIIYSESSFNGTDSTELSPYVITIEQSKLEEAGQSVTQAVTVDTVLEQVVDEMGANIQFMNFVSGDYDPKTTTCSDGKLIWKPIVANYTPQSDSDSGSAWHNNAARLTYRVRLKHTQSCAQHLDSGCTTACEHSYEVNESATLTYSYSNASSTKYTAAFPKPYVRGLLYDIHFQKVDATATNKPLPGAVFTLTWNGTTYEAASDASGNVSFTGLRWGSGTLSEHQPPEGYTKTFSPMDITMCYTTSPELLMADAAHTDRLMYKPDTVPWLVTNAPKVVASADIAIIKTDQDGAALAGAVFLLEKYDGSTWTAVTGYETFTPVIAGGSTEAKYIINSLPPGEYRLTEISAPSGYMKLAAPVEFTFDGSKITPSGPYTGVAFSTTSITFANLQGVSLPETGGSGITVYLLIGFALITLPLAVAAKRRKA